MTPQALAEQCANALWQTDTASQSLNMTLSNVGPGTATVSMPVSENMSNGHGTCHGGYIFTLADSAFAFACNSYNQRTVAFHCDITYLQPARTGELLTAHATETHLQGRNGIYDVVITRTDDEVIARFRGHSRTVKGTVLGSAAS
ncbi:MAG: hydroxyphenylacetyl-CoA thioesterase PaaI [Granulosicoccus sp.]|nr:hydroxyphenylacetyl-CoA thioesterase PaaI [Granulosicoccus sp.]